MPSVVDSLIVELALDPRQFTEGLRAALESFKKTKEGAESFARDIEGTGNKLSEIFSTVKKGAVGILGAFIGVEAASFIDKVASMDANTRRLARTMGESTRELSIWQNLVRSVGGTTEDATSSFAGLNDAFMNFAMNAQLPSPWFAQLLNRAGLSPFSMPTPHEALTKILPAIQGENPRMQAFYINQIPNLTANFRLLLLDMLRTSKSVDDLREKIVKAGVASDESGDSAIELARKTTVLQASLDNLARVGFPALTWLVDQLTSVLTNIGLLKESLSKTSVQVAPEGYWATLSRHAREWWDGQSGAGDVGAARRNLAERMTSGEIVGRPTQGTEMARGDRNNNPGNIEYGQFAVAHGATGSDGRFAIFPDWNTGANAMAALLRQRYQGMTLSGIQQRWTGTPNAGYLGGMSTETGLGPGEIPDINDPAVLKKLMRGMIHGEGSHIPMPAPTNNKTSSVTVGTINVASSKADPKAVADEIPDAIKRWTMLTGINTGLT